MVNPGTNPLPAEVRIKRHATGGKEFWGVEQEGWVCRTLDSYVYADRVQLAFRKVIARAMYEVFGLFDYVQHPDIPEKHFKHLPKPHDACIVDAIKIVDEVYQDMTVYYQTKIDSEADRDEKSALSATLTLFRKTWANVTPGFIARSILEITNNMSVAKNWNSHGAMVGASICQISAILAALAKAEQSAVISSSFRDIIPQGKVLTGSKHGHSDTSYVEYMTSSSEPKIVIGGEESYLEHNQFVGRGHAAKVRAVMDQTVSGMQCPAPRPTRAHTLDFNLSYMGARLIDGECKDKDDKDDAAVLVLHSLDQLAYSPSAIALLTSSYVYKIFYSTKDAVASRITTNVHHSRPYKLKPVRGNLDNADLRRKVDPPTIAVRGKAGTKLVTETGRRALEAWGKLRADIKEFICSTMETIDVLVRLLVKIDLEEVRDNRQQAYDRGDIEPYFLSTTRGELKSKREIPNQAAFKYSKANMEGGDTMTDAEKHRALKEECIKLLDSSAEITPAVRNVFTQMLEIHDYKS